MGKKQDILNATLELITEEGLQSVTLSKIFKRADVGSATLYNYFSNKEELVNELYRESLQMMGNYIIDSYTPSDKIYESFKSIVINLLHFAIEKPNRYLFIDTFSYSPYIEPALRRSDDSGAYSIFYKLIKDGQSQGLLKDINISMATQIVYGIISSVFKGAMIDKYPLDENSKLTTVEACWKALKL